MKICAREKLVTLSNPHFTRDCLCEPILIVVCGIIYVLNSLCVPILIMICGKIYVLNSLYGRILIVECGQIMFPKLFVWTDTNCDMWPNICYWRQPRLIGVITELAISTSCSGEESNWASAE